MEKADEILEIRWHGRGGQGTKTAVLLLAEAVIREGRFAQGFPEYGPERMGAPMRGYNRIAERPIRRRGPVTLPDVVVVLDPSLVQDGGLVEGLRPGGLILINTARAASELEHELPEVEGLRVHTVDATGIAREETGSAIPNTVMMGALLRLVEIAELDSLRETLKSKLGKGYAKGGSLVTRNLGALERAHKEVR